MAAKSKLLKLDVSHNLFSLWLAIEIRQGASVREKFGGICVKF